MANAIWYLLITAIVIPISGSIVAYVNARLARTTARETALLAAAQRRRDTEITQLRDAQTDLLTAATAVQSFVWYVDKDVRLRTDIDVDDWHAIRDLIEPAVVAAQRLRAVARTMPTEELRDGYIAVERLIMRVVRGSNDDNATDAWNEDVSGPQPDTITRAVNATADAIKQLYDSYPNELGAKPESAQLTQNAQPTKAIPLPKPRTDD
jgi:hypothetical protein